MFIAIMYENGYHGPMLTDQGGKKHHGTEPKEFKGSFGQLSIKAGRCHTLHMKIIPVQVFGTISTMTMTIRKQF